MTSGLWMRSEEQISDDTLTILGERNPAEPGGCSGTSTPQPSRRLENTPYLSLPKDSLKACTTVEERPFRAVFPG